MNSMNSEKIIGIVGGMGPFAGVDLARKVLEQTNAKRDQDHLSIKLISTPREIEDRTEFLLGKTDTNPADAIINIIKELNNLGASVIGIPCNTTFSPQIFNKITSTLSQEIKGLKIVNIIDEVIDFIQANYPNIKNIGVLSTIGAYKANVYKNPLTERGYNVVLPSEALQYNVVHRAIYDRKYGIKSKSEPITKKAKEWLWEAIGYLQELGAEAIILGCTELSLAIKRKRIKKVIIIDPTTILAKALVREANAMKMKEIQSAPRQTNRGNAVV
jgi:aspartate racemase